MNFDMDPTTPHLYVNYAETWMLRKLKVNKDLRLKIVLLRYLDNQFVMRFSGIICIAYLGIAMIYVHT